MAERCGRAERMTREAREAAHQTGAEDVVTYDDGAIDVYTAREEMGKSA